MQITTEKLKILKCRDLVPFQCKNCGTLFFRPKNDVLKYLKGKIKIECCSRKCMCQFKSKNNSIHIFCSNCQKPITIKNSSLRPHNFCDQHCSGIFNGKRRAASISQKLKTSKTLKTKYANGEISPYFRTIEEKSTGLKTLIPKNISLKKKRTRKTERESVCKTCGKDFVSIRGDKSWFPQNCSEKCRHEKYLKNANGNKKIFYKGSRLDSSWELMICEYLDKNNFRWELHPSPIRWFDARSNKYRTYHPDFYLPSQNLYIDPKNPLVINKSKYKLSVLSSQTNLLYGDIKMILARLEYIKNESYHGNDPSNFIPFAEDGVLPAPS